MYAEYIMRNAGLDEEQSGIKITRRNINNLRYALQCPSTTLYWQSLTLCLEMNKIACRIQQGNEELIWS